MHLLLKREEGTLLITEKSVLEIVGTSWAKALGCSGEENEITSRWKLDPMQPRSLIFKTVCVCACMCVVCERKRDEEVLFVSEYLILSLSAVTPLQIPTPGWCFTHSVQSCRYTCISNLQGRVKYPYSVPALYPYLLSTAPYPLLFFFLKKGIGVLWHVPLYKLAGCGRCFQGS